MTTNDEIVPGVMEGVIQKNIYLKVRQPEYLVALPPVIRMSNMLFSDSLPDRPQPIVVAVYRIVKSGEVEGDWNKYEFIGVEIR